MKKTRHAKILEIIRKFDVETQEELAGRLRDMGFSVTQATVSRDVRELGLFKTATPGGGQKYAVLKQDEGRMGDKYIRVLRDAFLDAEAAQNLLVVRTVPGMAMAVAAALDAMKFPEIVGSIAGDDTIFVAARTAEGARVLMEKIRTLIRSERDRGATS